MHIKPVIALGNESREGGTEVRTVGRKERGVAGPLRGPDGRQQGIREDIKHPPHAQETSVLKEKTPIMASSSDIIPRDCF